MSQTELFKHEGFTLPAGVQLYDNLTNLGIYPEILVNNFIEEVKTNSSKNLLPLFLCIDPLYFNQKLTDDYYQLISDSILLIGSEESEENKASFLVDDNNSLIGYGEASYIDISYPNLLFPALNDTNYINTSTLISPKFWRKGLGTILHINTVKKAFQMQEVFPYPVIFTISSVNKPRLQMLEKLNNKANVTGFRADLIDIQTNVEGTRRVY